MPRFFLTGAAPSGGVLTLTGAHAAHARVLRLRPGESCTVCDGRGTDYRCTVRAVFPNRFELAVDSAGPSAGEPNLRAAVFAAFSKQDRFDHVVRKATELGAAEIVAFPSARCVARPEGAALEKRLSRWRRIAESAAEQSGRGRIPEVSAAPSFEAALEAAAARELGVFFYEEERGLSFRAALAAPPRSTAALITGPEGGFTPEEAGAARGAGLNVCTLGSRILRCETAPLCALSALLFACGELE